MLRWFVAVGLCIASAGAVCRAETTAAGEFTYFRADRGLADDDAGPLPETFDDKELVWRQPIAPGHSTPCVSGDRIFLTTFDGKELATLALDRATGKPLWRQVAPAKEIEKYHTTGSPAAATPACDGHRVYSFFGSYGLLCYDTDGKLIWSKPLGPFQDEFGSASSPVLVDDKLLLAEDHDRGSYLMALEAATGKTIWQTPRDGATRSYSTPIVWNVAGRRQVILAGALELTGYDLDSGRQLWQMSGLARIVNTTPAVDGDTLLVATWSPGGDTDSRIAMEPWDLAIKQWDANGDSRLAREEVTNEQVLDRFYRIDLNQDEGLDRAEWEKYARVFELARNALLAVRPADAQGKTMQVAWSYEKGIPYVPSPLVYRRVVYLCKDGGIFTSLDAATGKLLKQGRLAAAGTYFASPVAGDGKIYAISDSGVLSVLSAGGRWGLLSSHDFGERTVATPVLTDGAVYVRTEAALYCYRRGR
ncbi:MAG TPA: PQQ-binding-like beta-propeller repeat protein [Pirellulales bacterium]|jgi:outer membrane protein assembly factor BamB|nr:PQQ-binding-like beta-propeller repeat protein [Pirellulales bacterium]